MSSQRPLGDRAFHRRLGGNGINDLLFVVAEKDRKTLLMNNLREDSMRETRKWPIRVG